MLYLSAEAALGAGHDLVLEGVLHTAAAAVFGGGHYRGLLEALCLRGGGAAGAALATG